MNSWRKSGAVITFHLPCEGKCGGKVRMEVDVGWVQADGGDPVDFLARNREKIASLHYKDFKDMTDTSTECVFGEGAVDHESCFAFAAETGIPEIFDKDTYGDDPAAEVRKALELAGKIRF